MKRPLAWTAVVFVMVLALLQIWDASAFKQSPIVEEMDGSKQLAGYVQDDEITICATIKDYSYNTQYEQITTELILKEVQILPQNEENSKDKIDEEKRINIGWGTTELVGKESETKLLQSGVVTNSRQTIIAYVTGKYNVNIGSRVILTGKLAFWKSATNPGEFDAEKYYSNRDVLFSIKKAEILKISLSENEILQNLKDFRLRQEIFLDEFLPYYNSAIMKAMLFGNKKEIEEEIKSLYQNNGIAHILAISGLHISLIGMSVYRLLRYLPLPRWLVLLGSESFLILYGCMVGFSASTFRAIFMFTLFLLSKLLKRSYDMITAMAASAIFQLLIHPGYLFDCGFQLSYAAIMGIAILLPALEEIVDLIKNKYLRKGISLFLPSLSVTLFTAPILIYHYYELSFFSIVLNFIVLPLMGPLLLAGIGLLCMGNVLAETIGMIGVTEYIGLLSMFHLGSESNILSFAIQIFAQIFSFAVNGILWIFETGCKLLELLPIGRKNVAPLPIWAMFIYYILVLMVTVSVKQKKHLYQLGFVLVEALILIFPQKLEFSVCMLDVGQGDCNVIFAKEGKCFVIDCGSTSKYNVGEKILIPFLKYHGIGKVDGVIVTHPDADHMNGVLELVELGKEENISIKGIYIGEHSYTSEPEEWEELIELATEQDISVQGISQGDSLCTETVSMECIYPLREQSGLTGNAASLVMKIECGEFQGLFTGDLEMDGEMQLLAEYGGGEKSNAYGDELVNYIDTEGNGRSEGNLLFDEDSCDLLKVGHHGSSGSSSTEFLRWVSPEYAVISCGENNSYGHPHEETLERLEEEGIKYLITYEEGAICFQADN